MKEEVLFTCKRLACPSNLTQFDKKRQNIEPNGHLETHS